MDRNSALIFAAIMVAGIVIALIRGDAAAGGRLGREDEPMLFWVLISIYATFAMIMLYVAWHAR